MNTPSQVASLPAFLRNTLLVLAVLITGSAHAEDDDPPSRIARLAYLSGAVTFAPAGDDAWNQASINRPLTTGDRLLTEDNARAAMDLDSGDLRIGSNTGFNFLNLDDRGTQIELSRGTLNWRVDSIVDGQNNEVDTPTVAFVIKQPGTYKIVVSEDGSSTTVSILQGAGTVYGEGGASYPISGRQSWRFGDSKLTDIIGSGLASADDFDLWCNDLDKRASATASNNYVSTEVVGYNDLHDNGDWDTVAEYGNVWYPRTVAVGWAPYRYGHWAWVAPWGWTWIDDAPWGFAPFHYGRWVYVSNRWGWVPGPRNVRPVYSPAMVAFVGGSGWSVSVSSGQPIGWVPLGPRDVYRPWYRGSQRYFTRVNVTNVININHVHVTNVYKDYRGNRGGNVRYMNQSAPGGTTVVTRDSFTRGRPVFGAQVRVDRSQLERAPSMSRFDLPPGRPGQGLQSSGLKRGPSQEFTRPPVSYRKPPQASLGVRDNQRNPSSSFGDGRPGWQGRDNTPNPRGDNNASPQSPRGRDSDSPWNRNTQRNDDQRPGAMPSSRFSPWGSRGDGRNAPQNTAPAPSQQTNPQTQPRDYDPRWNHGNPQQNDNQRPDIAKPSRVPSWGGTRNDEATPSAPQQDIGTERQPNRRGNGDQGWNRGNVQQNDRQQPDSTAPSRFPSWGSTRGNAVTPPSSQPDTAPAQQPAQRGDGNQRWNLGGRRNNDASDNQPQQQPTAPQQRNDQPIGRSPARYEFPRPIQNTPAPQQPQSAQPQGQGNGGVPRMPFQRQESQNRGQPRHHNERPSRPEREHQQREPG